MKTTLLIAAAALIGFASANAIADGKIERLTQADKLKFNACVGTLKSDRESDPHCLAIMKRANIPAADMEKMHDCEGVFNNVDRDAACQQMIKKYPKLVRGHGESMSPTDRASK